MLYHHFILPCNKKYSYMSTNMGTLSHYHILPLFIGDFFVGGKFEKKDFTQCDASGISFRGAKLTGSRYSDV